MATDPQCKYSMNNFSIRQLESQYNPHHPDRTWYWTVFNHETAQSIQFNYKHDALIYQQTLPHATLYFHWHENQFAKLNVTLEPVESHAELCRQRAQELRNTYKYVRLFFSGGSDSLTALHSFVDNNIHLDEILISNYFDGDNYTDPTRSSGMEIKLYALPYIRKIAHLIPNTKITVVDPTVQDANEWFHNWGDNPENIPVFDSVEGQQRFGLDYNWLFLKVNRETTHEDWCDIHGGSKVRLFKNQDRWYFYAVDSMMSDMANAARSEDFFISKNIPTLYLKTVYLLKKFYMSQNFDDATVNEYHLNTSETGRAYNAAMGRNVAPGLAAYKLYYKTHDPDLWKNNFVSGWDCNNFFKNVVNTTEGQDWLKNYKRNINEMLLLSPGQWNVDQLGNPVPSFGRKGHLSKFYCLNDGMAYDSTQTGQPSGLLASDANRDNQNKR
jgi:hypothetical protein